MVAETRRGGDAGTRRYAVYLEMAEDGRCMAHVPDLPGCIVRASDRDEALRRVPEAIRETLAWLRRHGEAVPTEEKPVEIEIAAESIGFGPFDPGDAAALFPPDREPVSPEEMERAFRFMAYARADLLALVRDLPDELLDWQPDERSFSIRRLLRHVGNAEEWYVSRLVPPETLPPEWKHDEEMPVFEFLEMERRTAIARLRQLTQEERAGVFYPARWTGHPEEPWTARKVLRRFLEHEREHTAQVREILDRRRRHLLSRVAAERASLLWQLMGLDERTLTETVVLDSWTVRDILAHIAAWDRWEYQTMRRMAEGEPPDFTAVQDIDRFNADVVATWRERSLSEVLTELKDARAAWVAWLEALPVEVFFRSRPFGECDWSFPSCVEVQWKHDAEHTDQIAAWREAQRLKGEPWNTQTGSKRVLLAALAAAREELLTAAALVPPEERTSRRVCGEWTLKDVLGHVADWEWLGVEGLRHMAAGQPPRVEHVEDVDAWNQAHAEARREQPWDDVWADFHAARQALLTVLEGVDQADMGRLFPAPWAESCTPYAWVFIYIAHDREHAGDLRE
ncbi:MAG TPA: DUF664 domain-containing protein [Anaerolineae bacterium]|nr:DUF664 domain-containing protein [Anaerolineae bacterium]